MAADKDIILLSNETEANLLEALLKEEGIPHVFKRYTDPAYDGLLTYKDSWGHVDAPQEFREQVRKLLEGIRRQPPQGKGRRG
jgi:hypothetical protein